MLMLPRADLTLLLPGIAHGSHAELLTDSCTTPVLLIAAIL